MAETPTFGRYAEIPYDQMTPEQQEGYRSLIETRGRLPGPNKIYVHNPKLAQVMGPLGAHFRTGYSLSEREREIAVCIITSKWHAAYPTNAHERAGKAAGLGLVKKEDANIQQYVTGKALDGLYLMIGEEERKIRRDPVGTGSAILKKVFGALK